MSDITKRLEKAEKYLQKGRQQDALAEYLEALREDPHNDNVRQTAADLSITLGRGSDALGLLTPLFEHQAAIGDTIKAVASYRKMARLGTPSVEHTFRFAQLIEKSSKRESLDAYHVAADGFLAAGKKADALAARKRIVALEPTAENFRREGELAAEVGDGKSAATAFLSVGDLEEKGGGDAFAWYERAHSHDSSNPDIAFAYGRTLLQKGDAARAITILAPFANTADARIDIREIYAKALLADKRLVEAEPFIWHLFERDPKQVDEVASLISALIDSEQHSHALDLAHKLEQQQVKAGNQREYVALIKEVVDKHPPGVEFLEYMVEVYNSANREHDYCGALLKLFELYYASGNFLKAADCLDRAAEVDAYEPGHQRRLEMLRGKIDAHLFNSIAQRFSGVMTVTEQQQPKGAADSETTVLEDLMLQAEIFLQYSMRTKAVERLERINKLFPREEEKVEKLRKLYNNAGFFPKYGPGTPAPAPAAPAASPASPAPSAAAAAAPPPAPAAAPSAAANEAAVDNFARVTEITRSIYRQGSVKGVLFTAVNEIGRHWNASRCVAGLLNPGKPPSAALEYCAPGITQAEVMAIVKLVVHCQSLAINQGVVTLANAAAAPELDPIRSHIGGLDLRSLMAVPLLDGEEHVGILILAQCGAPRAWRPTDEVVLKTIAEQMVLAVNNARLRSLVKTLAVTDEKSGLLKRSSYLDVLLSEVRRAMQQNSTVTVMLMHFGAASALVREVGEPAVESMIQQIGQIVTSHIRQNDVAVRYELTTIAVILADTNEKNSFFVVDKLRKVMGSVNVPGKGAPPPLAVGIAEAVMQSRFDPVDIVTEVINRAQSALEAARSEGPNAAKSLAAALDTATVGA
jgi:diguanylate cyclase (GGDEF)-like protein